MQSLKSRTVSRTAAVLAAVLRRLPTSVTAHVKGQLAPVARLDWDGGRILMHADSVIDLQRANACAKEPETVAWITSELRRGDVFYDVGANVGAYSLVAGKRLAEGGSVYAFEPSFSTFAQLCRNVVLNRLEATVTPHMLALSDKTSVTRFNYQSLDAGAAVHTVGAAIDYKGAPFQPVYRQEILAFSIDDLVSQHGFPAPTAIKLDVDGTELEVLRGASRILDAGNVRTLMIEVCPTNGADEIVRYLESKQYVLAQRYPHNPLVENFLFRRQGVTP